MRLVDIFIIINSLFIIIHYWHIISILVILAIIVNNY